MHEYIYTDFRSNKHGDSIVHELQTTLPKQVRSLEKNNYGQLYFSLGCYPTLWCPNLAHTKSGIKKYIENYLTLVHL